MSWNSCSETCSGDPGLQSVLYKVQDYLSTRAPGDRFAESDFRGIRAPHESVRDVLQVLVEHGVLGLVESSLCPNSSCGGELEDRAGTFVCQDCNEDVGADEGTIVSLYVLTLKPERCGGNGAAPGVFKRPFVFVDSNAVAYGERDEDHIYLSQEYPGLMPNLLVRDGASVFRLVSYTFEPEYGNQPRRFAYKYIIHSQGDFMQQNVMITGDGNTVGDVIQQKSEWNYTPERMEQVGALLMAMKSVADANGADQRLVGFLEKAIAQKQDKKTVLSTLNQLVSWAADYGAVISPFIPAITALLTGTPAS